MLMKRKVHKAKREVVYHHHHKFAINLLVFQTKRLFWSPHTESETFLGLNTSATTAAWKDFLLRVLSVFCSFLRELCHCHPNFVDKVLYAFCRNIEIPMHREYHHRLMAFWLNFTFHTFINTHVQDLLLSPLLLLVLSKKLNFFCNFIVNAFSSFLTFLSFLQV